MKSDRPTNTPKPIADAQRMRDDVRGRLIYVFKTTTAMVDLQLGVSLSLINLFRGRDLRVLTVWRGARIAIDRCRLSASATTFDPALAYQGLKGSYFGTSGSLGRLNCRIGAIRIDDDAGY